MTEKPEASVLTARRAAQHFRLSSADDACEHLYILTVRSSLGPSPPNAGRYTVASRFRCRSCERGYIVPRAPEQFVASPLCLVGYVRWDARSDRVPPLQTIIFSSFTGRTLGGRPPGSWPKPVNRSAVVGTNPTGELITSGLSVNGPQSVNAARLRNARGERKVLQEKFGEAMQHIAVRLGFNQRRYSSYVTLLCR
jgi:hypothetical protein